MRYDFTLTEDGDLVLGQQVTDENGKYLYYLDTSNNNEPPIITTDPEGNIPIRDARVSYDNDVRLQLIHTRIRTDNPDFSLYPEIGANLSDLIGLPNNEATAMQGVDQIYACLTADGAFQGEELDIQVAPVSRDSILFDIKLLNSDPYLRFAVVFNFNVGILNAYELAEED